MGKTQSTGNLTNGISQDSSNNIGIGAAPSGTYKFEVTGTAKISGVATFGSTLSNGTYAYTLPSATGTLALTSALGDYLPLTGGTLTGALNGTSASFSSTGRFIGALTIGTDFAQLLPISSSNYQLLVGNYYDGTNLIATATSGSRTVYNVGGMDFRTFTGATVGSSVTDTSRFTIASTGAATFSSTLQVGGNASSTITIGDAVASGTDANLRLRTGSTKYSWLIASQNNIAGFEITPSTTVGGTTYSTPALSILPTGAATFSSSVQSASNFSVARNGSNSVQAGYILETTSGTLYLANLQLDTSGGLNTWTYNPTNGWQNRMTLTSAGNVGIGTSSPALPLEIYRAAGTACYVSTSVGSNTFLSGVDAGGLARLFTGGATDISFWTNSTERMRITSGGYTKISNNGTYFYAANTFFEVDQSIADWTQVNVNKVASGTPLGIFVGYTAQSPNSAGAPFYAAQDSGTTRFEVRSNGGIANFQANDVNLSDERTKKEIILLESYWDKFKAIEIVKFKYKDQTHDDFNIGVIAQQVESVAPEFVDVDSWGNTKLGENVSEIESNEEPLKSVYTSDLHHATIKVLQEAMLRIEEQQAQIEELKLKIK